MLTRANRRIATPRDVADEPAASRAGRRSGWAAAGGVLGAVAASSCCIVPLVLLSLGISGAWIGRLTALEPYRPLFIAVAACFLAYGYWLVYRASASGCEAGEACARPLPNRLVKIALGVSTALIVLALFWGSIAPLVAPILLGL